MILRPSPLQVYVHGALFLSWIGVFVAQTMLISAHRVWFGPVSPFFPENVFLALSATICLLGPAWDHILPISLLGPLGGVAAMVFDVRTRGKIYPAHYWTLLAVLINGFGPPLLGSTAPFDSLVKALSPA
jgi:hypothetical protein